MKLSVIIPCYKDDPTQAINSIKNQLYYDPRDVEIILCMDDPKRKKTKYPDVTVLPAKTNTGAGLARQRGIDAAHGEYVTFLDADDIWYNALGYALFLRDIYWQNGRVADIAKFGILEQLTDGGFSPFFNDCTWCFGKFYCRAFLTDNNIRFHPDLRVHEDSYFVRLAELCNPRVLNHNDALYLWRTNPKSTVRGDGGNYWQAAFAQYIKVLMMLRDERLQRGLPYDVASDLAYIYVMVSRMDDKYRKECFAAIKDAAQDWSTTALQTKLLFAHIRASENCNNTPQIAPRLTLEEFLKEIEA